MCGGVLLNHFLVYFFERRYLPEPGARPVSSRDPALSSYRGLLYLGAEELNSCFHGNHFTDESTPQNQNLPWSMDVSRIKTSALFINDLSSQLCYTKQEGLS